MSIKYQRNNIWLNSFNSLTPQYIYALKFSKSSALKALM